MAPRLDKAMTYINKSQSIGGFSDNFVAGLSAVVLTFFTALVGLGESIANLPIALTDATTESSVEIVYGTLRAPALFVQDTWNQAAVAMGMGPWNELGPFIALVGLGVLIAALMMLGWAYDQMNTDFLGTGLDVPWLGRDSDGEED